MSKFHFDETVMDNNAAILGALNTRIDVYVSELEKNGRILAMQKGFSVEGIFEDLLSEKEKLKYCGDRIGEGKNDLTSISQCIKNSAAAATGNNKVTGNTDNSENDPSLGTSDDKEVCPPDDRYHDDDRYYEDDSSHDDDRYYDDDLNKEENASNDENTNSNGWLREDGNYEYSFSANTHIIKDSATNGGNYYKIVPASDMFGGWNGGYVQTRSERSGGREYGWFEKDYQCVATAMATTAVYNGGDSSVVTPHAYYSQHDYWIGEKGCAVGCNFGGFNLDIIKEKLSQGKASTIYAHTYADEIRNDEGNITGLACNNGHAVTVVGYVNGGNSVDDLLVIDPWDGREYRLGDCFNVKNPKKGFSGRLSLDYSN